MKKSDIIRHASVNPDGLGRDCVDIFGKFFAITAIDKKLRIVVNLDFPLINQNDIDDFVSKSARRSEPVLSCRPVRVHPYRLMTVGEDGFDDFWLDIPQSIRGNRHHYPRVFECVPALVAIPADFDARFVNTTDAIGLHELDERKLLDKTKTIDRLLINCIQKTSDEQATMGKASIG